MRCQKWGKQQLLERWIKLTKSKSHKLHFSWWKLDDQVSNMEVKRNLASLCKMGASPQRKTIDWWHGSHENPRKVSDLLQLLIEFWYFLIYILCWLIRWKSTKNAWEIPLKKLDYASIKSINFKHISSWGHSWRLHLVLLIRPFARDIHGLSA